MPKYSQKFINKIKEVYPKEKTLVELAKTGDFFVGRFLDDARSHYPYKAVFSYLNKSGYNEEDFNKFVKFIEREHAKWELYTMLLEEDSNPKYSSKLIAKVQEAFPEDEVLIDQAKAGSRLLMRIADDRRSYAFENLHKFLTTKNKTNEEKFEEIMKRAKSAEAQTEVYQMWWDESKKDSERDN